MKITNDKKNKKICKFCVPNQYGYLRSNILDVIGNEKEILVKLLDRVLFKRKSKYLSEFCPIAHLHPPPLPLV